MFAAGLEPAVSTSERTQTYTLDRAITGIGSGHNYTPEKQGGSNMTGTDLYVNKPHCVAALRP